MPPTDPAPMTDKELDAIDVRHFPIPASEGSPLIVCDYCLGTPNMEVQDVPWPCDAARLLAELRRQRRRAQALDQLCAYDHRVLAAMADAQALEADAGESPT